MSKTTDILLERIAVAFERIATAVERSAATANIAGNTLDNGDIECVPFTAAGYAIETPDKTVPEGFMGLPLRVVAGQLRLIYRRGESAILSVRAPNTRKWEWAWEAKTPAELEEMLVEEATTPTWMIDEIDPGGPRDA